MALFTALAVAGNLFLEPRRITPEGFAAVQPQAASDGRRVAVACGRGDRIFVLVSSDSGRTFGKPVGLPAIGMLSLGMRRGPRIAAAKGAITVTAVYGRKGGGADGDLFAWRSGDGGKTWKGPSRVSDVRGAAREGLHGMAASSGGLLACAWLDLRGKGTEVWTSVSGDGGANWSKNVLAYRSPSGTVCECCHPSVAFGPDGRLHVMFRNSLDGARDMYLCSSSDGGKSFGTARKLGNGTWALDACPMDGGALAVKANGTIETAWRRGGKVYLCVPGRDEREVGCGTRPWIATAKNESRVVWLGEDGRVRATLKVRFTEGVDPVAVSSDGQILAIWADGSGRVWSQRL